MKRVLLVAMAGTILGCGDGSTISGEHGGSGDCPYKLKFSGKDTVYVNFLGMMEMPGTYKMDGDKISIAAPNWPGAVFTRKER